MILVFKVRIKIIEIVNFSLRYFKANLKSLYLIWFQEQTVTNFSWSLWIAILEGNERTSRINKRTERSNELRYVRKT